MDYYDDFCCKDLEEICDEICDTYGGDYSYRTLYVCYLHRKAFYEYSGNYIGIEEINDEIDLKEILGNDSFCCEDSLLSYDKQYIGTIDNIEYFKEILVCLKCNKVYYKYDINNTIYIKEEFIKKDFYINNYNKFIINKQKDFI